MRGQDWIQLGQLVVAAVGLVFLIKYVRYTRKIAEQAANQSEASFKPAIVAIHRGATDVAPLLRNIGKGPALNINWRVSNSAVSGNIEFLEPGGESGSLPLQGRSQGLIRCGDDIWRSGCCDRVLV
jgi:hypothetical protein